ncbi:MAG TPA: hypothetical protein VL326_24890 [Kofleriaceae bacterium]|jgi:hypothetical protein|nr:hypothetical protein [Kofleriaceae bacterium]
MAAVLSAAVIAACFSKPGAPHVGDGDGGVHDDGAIDPDARIDARMIDAFVTTPCVKDDFSDTSAVDCEPWGDVTHSGFGSILHIGQTLVFDLGMSGNVVCTTSAPMDITHGTSIHVVTPSSYLTSLSILLPDQATPVTFKITPGGAMLNVDLVCPGGVNAHGMTGAAPAWMQLRVTPGTTAGTITVFAETAVVEPGTWTPSLQCSFPGILPLTATVSFEGSGSGSVTWDDFNEKNCP